jgi:hypothetical protein
VHPRGVDAFATLLGDLHEESYIYVQDVRAAAYGYGGRTQEWRFRADHHAGACLVRRQHRR